MTDNMIERWIVKWDVVCFYVRQLSSLTKYELVLVVKKVINAKKTPRFQKWRF